MALKVSKSKSVQLYRKVLNFIEAAMLDTLGLKLLPLDEFMENCNFNCTTIPHPVHYWKSKTDGVKAFAVSCWKFESIEKINEQFNNKFVLIYSAAIDKDNNYIIRCMPIDLPQ